MANNWVAAEKAFVHYWKVTRRGHLERLPDKKDLVGLNGGRNVADFSKPSDFLVSAKGVPLHYAEVKSTENKSRFPFSKIRPKQSSAALRSALQGDGNYIFYIFSYHTEKWYQMPAVQYAACVDEGHRSIPFLELNEWQM